MTQPIGDKPEIYVVVVVLVLGVFAIDVWTNLGAAIGVLYFVPVTLCLMTSRPSAPVIVSAVCVLLIGAGYLLSPLAPESKFVWISQINRGLSAGVVTALGAAGWWMVAAKVRIELQEWIKEGRTALSVELQGEQEMHELVQSVLRSLAEYVGAQVGSVYVGGPGGALTRRGSYGLDLPNDDPGDAIDAGQTLVGQAAEDGRIVVVDDVPEGYVDVRSGIGRARPRTLVLVPTRADDAVNGVVELGFFRTPGSTTLEFLTNAADSVGVAIRSAQYRQRQVELLEEWQTQAEELVQQQEELRAVNEQLAEQTEEAEMQTLSLQATETVLRQKAAELERASRYKSEFLANMSHELRTPLNSSLILAKLLMQNKDGNLTEKQVKYASSIYAAGNELLEVINDILDLSKIEAGKIEVNLEPVSVDEVLEQLRRRFEPLAGEKRLDLVFSVEPDVPGTIETDPHRLQQILTNLLSNSVKFTAEGVIRLTVESRGPGHVAFSVSDTGIGIPDEQQELVFKAFRQADGTTNRKFGGTGLGLSICRELSGLLGGEIQLESTAGEGSTFTVTIPSRLERVTASPNAAVAESPPRGPRPGPSPEPDHGDLVRVEPFVEDDRETISESDRVVLLVEDDAAFAEIVRDLAHELDFHCVIAGGAEEGLHLAREYEPAAVILDIGLPDASGLAVLEGLKRGPKTRHIPVHVVSVHDHEQLAREMGAAGYSIKPVDRDDLASALRVMEANLARTPKRVLVVEDDSVQRGAILDLLESDDVGVTTAESAEEALDALASHSFDCVVLDLMLPDLSGFEILERMSERGDGTFPPVIIYTARALTPEEEQRLRRDSRSIIIKGARSPERLLEEVTLFLHQVEHDLPPEKRRMLAAARERETAFDGRRVLLVEDDVRNIFAVTSFLEPQGITVDVARNGREALARLSQNEPPIDLILMDVMMPEIDGLEATREIRKREGAGDGNGTVASALPIIAVTAKAMPNDRDECLAAGANDYLSKPVDVDRLLSLLRVWMPRPR